VQRPIFIVGFPRSGTTLLQSLLGAHPNIAAPPEVHFFLRIYNVRDYWGDLADDQRAAAAMRALVRAPADLFANCGFDEDALVRKFLAGDRSYRSLLATLLDDFAERQGKARWSEKTPQQMPAQAWHLMPDAQVVHIHRDPRAVIASNLATWSDRRPPWLIAQEWSNYTRTVLAEGRAKAGSFVTIRYEDLADDPEPVLRSLCEFLGEDFTAQMLTPAPERMTAVAASTLRWQSEAGAPVRPAASRWSTIPLPQRALAGSALVHDLDALGYPAEPPALAALGRLLGPARSPRLLRDRRRARLRARELTTPEAKYAAVCAFIDAELRVRLSGQ
jgi:hypothetical protein